MPVLAIILEVESMTDTETVDLESGMLRPGIGTPMMKTTLVFQLIVPTLMWVRLKAKGRA